MGYVLDPVLPFSQQPPGSESSPGLEGGGLPLTLGRLPRLPGPVGAEAPASEPGSLSECLLPLAEGSCGQGFWVSGKWGAVLELGGLGALGNLPFLLPREERMVAGCLSQNLSTGRRLPGDL